MLFEKELERLSIPHGHLQDIASDVKEKYIKTEGDDLLDLSDHFLWVGPIANHEAHSELSPSASIAWPTNMHKSESHSHYELHIESLPSGSILVFDSFPTVVQNLNFENIFQYFDDLILFVRYFRSLNKKLTMLWIMPKVSSLKYGSGIDELQAVFQHLTIMHVINRLGIMVTDASDLDHVKENVLHHLNMLHHFSLQHYETFPHEYGTLSKISTSHSAEFQHRVKLLSSYLSNFYSTEGQVVGSFNHFHGKTVISRESSTLQDACFKFVNTRKFSSTCFPSVGKRYPLLVTGLGGSGTHFVANSLQQLGFPINHESIGQLGSVVSTHLTVSNIFIS